MVAQVRALVLAAQRQDREHQPPLGADGVQACQRPPVAGVGPRADVVQQHVDGDATPHRPLQGGEEGLGRGVDRHDVELAQHVALRRVDRGRHLRDRVAVVLEQGHRVPGDHRQRAEVAVEGGDGLHPLQLRWHRLPR
ncbi:hypothetical protein SDC9_177519 [bioreactor metagenome]|uniref:Uncharacterized protein n=1 Tax=bioreactor metagenome TaxID=1076179 RepID=A0A645GVL1_9ZZZZ